MSRRKKADVVDDGRVIADMNVDGMPWTTPRNGWGVSGGVMKREREARARDAGEENWIAKLDKRAYRSLMANATLAGLALVGIYIGFFSLVIWLMTLVW